MMTPAELHLLTDRRIAAIRETLDSLEASLARLVAHRREQKRIENAHLDCMDSRKSGMADS